MARKQPVWASYWQFDPTTQEEAEVEAMPAAVKVQRTDEDRVMISARGKPGRRYETGDSMWMELADEEAIRLIESIATALGERLAFKT